MSKNILITGGTGLVGSRLTSLLHQKGHHIAIMSRSKKADDKYRYFLWDVESQTIEVEALHWADCIIHLAGAGVADKKWTDARKKEILDSRVKGTKLLVNTLIKNKIELPHFITASAIGIYGMDTGQIEITEESPAGNDFLAQVTVAWEHALEEAPLKHTLKSFVRIGIVLSKEGGALAKIAAPVKLFAGAPLGSGKQQMSWIHIEDLCRVFEFLVENRTEGKFNATAPNPVSNAELTKEIAKALKKPLILPNVPAFALKLALGEQANMILGGAKVLPKNLKSENFSFNFPIIGAALENIYSN